MPVDARRVVAEGQHTHFSVWIPTATEYRVWTICGKAIAIYEKVYKGSGEYDGFMRNRRFGFKFEKKDELRETKAITKPAIEAVKALHMDFGAVDILKGKDGKFYVLEVNSMPHIDNLKRSSGVRLAKAISNWAEASQ
jgi:glutathione synthase/RimK-type ligase-like ATP-grasp enzyme